jgi:AcrR family transcriptional regulator
MTGRSVAGPQRRRGAALEEALLAAAWEELAELGYARFTMEGVADRAKTSRPVLYRRWPDRWELALAAVRDRMGRNPVVVPDTGSLREDLIAYLREGSAKRAEFITLFSLQMTEFYAEAQSTPAEFREQVIAGRSLLADEIYARAIARGEIDPARLTPRVRELAFDLLRNEMTMYLRPVPADVITEIVDDIVLPLLTGPGPAHGTTPRTTRRRSGPSHPSGQA